MGEQGAASSAKPCGYAGDVSPKQAWDQLARDAKAVLVDVRTSAEWQFVGVPVLEALGREPLLIEWQFFPSRPNEDFIAQASAGLRAYQASKVFLLCRSGQRSAAAAAALSEAGFAPCYNILEGFEGALDANKHRGTKGGWKQAGLPWIQN